MPAIQNTRFSDLQIIIHMFLNGFLCVSIFLVFFEIFVKDAAKDPWKVFNMDVCSFNITFFNKQKWFLSKVVSIRLPILP